MSEPAGNVDAPRRTSPIGLIPHVVKGLRQTIFPIIAGWFAMRSIDLVNVMAVRGILGILVVIMLVVILDWWRRTYTTGPDDIRVESGLLSRKARSVPYERIQDVSVEQNLVARLLGLAELKFETGAGGKDDIALAYVSEAEGERLRRLVRSRRAEATSGAATGEEAEAARAGEESETEDVLFAMSPGRVALFGLFEFSLVVFGVLAGLLQQFDFLLPFDIWAASQWRDRFGGLVGWMIGFGLQAQIVAAVFGLISVAIVGVLTGVARTAVREWGFTLTRSERGFRRRRGLFTRTDVVMPVHRVQAGIVTTGWLRRLWGWHGLKFVSLAQDSGGSNHDAAPFAQMEEILPIVGEAALRMPPDSTHWHRAVAARWLVGFGALALVTLYAAAMAGWWIDPLAGVAVAGLGIPLVAARQWLDWRQYRHALDSGQLYYRSGVFSRKLMIAPRQRIQSVEIRQGPLGRLADYVELHFGLPGGHLRFAGVRRADAEQIRAEVMRDIAATDYSRLQADLEA